MYMKYLFNVYLFLGKDFNINVLLYRTFDLKLKINQKFIFVKFNLHM